MRTSAERVAIFVGPPPRNSTVGAFLGVLAVPRGVGPPASDRLPDEVAVTPESFAFARTRLPETEAGVAEMVEVRLGDALITLRSLPGPVDLLCLDGWNELYLPVLQLVAPHLSPDALVVADLSADAPDLEHEPL